MDSTLQHLKELTGTLIGRLMDASHLWMFLLVECE